MQYIFGFHENREILQTIGDTHSNLNGLQAVTVSGADCTITDSFYVQRKYKSEEDADGNCLDWYFLLWHSRTIDRAPSLKPQVEENSQAIDDIIVSLLEGGN